MGFRPVLLALLIVLSGRAGLAADSGSEPGDQRTVFRSVIVDNEDPVPRTVDVVVLHDGAVVHWTTRQIEGRTGNTKHAAVVDPPEMENTTRTYTVLVRVNGSTDGVRYRLDPVDRSGCYSVGATVNDGSLRGPVIRHWNDDVYDHCAEPWNRTTGG